MIINPIPVVKEAPVASPVPTAAAGDAPTADYNVFLKLLIAQLRNQDPTAPSDPTKYVSQLASFSAVKETTESNKLLTALCRLSIFSEEGALAGKYYISRDGKTKGVIKSVRAFADGVQLTLANGKTVTMNIGDQISLPEQNDDKPKKDDKSKKKDNPPPVKALANYADAHNTVQEILQMLGKQA